MADALLRTDMTVEEFLQWNLSQDERYELVDGMPVPLRAMSGATAEHDTIVVNLIAALAAQLAGTPCRPRTADTAVRTKIDRVRRPDVTIDCGGVEKGRLDAREPVAVFEVLSPTTRKNDRSVKLQEYMRHARLRAVVHIDPDEMDVLVYARAADGTWIDERLEKPEDIVRIADTPVALTLATIYNGVPLGRPRAGQDPPQ